MKNIVEKFEDLFMNENRTLLEISKDDEGVAVSQLQSNAYCFDSIVKSLSNSNKCNYCSPDALIFKEASKTIIFIEFKNRTMKEGGKEHNKALAYGVRLKALEGMLAFGEILKKYGLINKFSELEKLNFKYLVVYSSAKNPNLLEVRKGMEKNKNHRDRYETKYKLLFELDRYENIIFSKILTIDNELFDEKYNSIIS